MINEDLLQTEQDFYTCPLSRTGHQFSKTYYWQGYEIRCKLCLRTAISVLYENWSLFDKK